MNIKQYTMPTDDDCKDDDTAKIINHNGDWDEE